MQHDMLYSPHPPASYSRINEDGYPVGVGRELSFEGRRAWWNLYWLSDPRVDGLLAADPQWELAPGANWDIVRAAAKTVNRQKLGGEMVAGLLCTLTPAQFVEQLRQHKHDHLFVARLVGPGWLETVASRAGEFRGTLVVEGNITFANFGRKPADQKVEQVKRGSATIMPLS